METDDQWKKVGDLVTSPKSLAEPNKPHMLPSTESVAWATTMTRRFCASFKKADDGSDIEVFFTVILEMFCRYERSVVEAVCSLTSGLPSKEEWLPSLGAVARALEVEREASRGYDERVAYWNKRADQQLAARHEWEAQFEGRPTYDELKSMYGENWGLHPEEVDPETQKRRDEWANHISRLFYERECLAAGLPANSPVSPSLLKLLKEQDAKRSQ